MPNVLTTDSGEGRESVLRFDDGGLRLSGNISRNSSLRGLRLHAGGTGQTLLSYEDITVNSAPTRIYLDDVELSSETPYQNAGLYMRGGWIGMFSNPIIRGLGTGVLMEKSTDGPGVSWNGFNFVGGEIQGNRTGVDMGGVLNINFFGTAIEGNRNNGALIRNGCRGIGFYGAYFEANGIDDPQNTNDIRIEVDNALSTVYSVVVDSGCTFLRGGVGSEAAIWAKKCRALIVEEGAAFNGYVNKLVAAEIAPGTVTGAFRAISEGSSIPWVNDTNSFGDPRSLIAHTPITMANGVTATSPEVFVTLPSYAATRGVVAFNYTAADAGDVLFQVQPFDVATGVALATVNVVPTAAAGRNIASTNLDFNARAMRGKTTAIRIARLGASSSDTNTGDVTLHSIEVKWNA